MLKAVPFEILKIISEKWHTSPRPAGQKKVSDKIPEHIEYRI